MGTNWLWLLVRENLCYVQTIVGNSPLLRESNQEIFRHGSSHPPPNHDRSTGFDSRPNADSWTSVPTAAVRVHSLAPASHLSPLMSLPQVNASHMRALTGRPLRMSDLRLSEGLITRKVILKKPYTAHFLLFKQNNKLDNYFLCHMKNHRHFH